MADELNGSYPDVLQDLNDNSPVSAQNLPLTQMRGKPTSTFDVENRCTSPLTLLNGKRKPSFLIPPLPVLLYTGLERTHSSYHEGKAIYVYCIMISMDLRKNIDGKVDPIQITKDIFSKIKASDSAALLVPIKDQ